MNDVMSTKTAKDILVGARNLIDCGPELAHGTFYNQDTGCYCVLGAINEAAFGNSCAGFPEDVERGEEPQWELEPHSPQLITAYLDASRALTAAAGIEFRHLPLWNDDRKTTRETVLDALDKAIAELDGANDAEEQY